MQDGREGRGCIPNAKGIRSIPLASAFADLASVFLGLGTGEDCLFLDVLVPGKVLRGNVKVPGMLCARFCNSGLAPDFYSQLTLLSSPLLVLWRRLHLRWQRHHSRLQHWRRVPPQLGQQQLHLRRFQLPCGRLRFPGRL